MGLLMTTCCRHQLEPLMHPSWRAQDRCRCNCTSTLVPFARSLYFVNVSCEYHFACFKLQNLWHSILFLHAGVRHLIRCNSVQMHRLHALASRLVAVKHAGHLVIALIIYVGIALYSLQLQQSLDLNVVSDLCPCWQSMESIVSSLKEQQHIWLPDSRAHSGELGRQELLQCRENICALLVQM